MSALARAAALLGSAAPPPGSPTGSFVAALAALLAEHGDARAAAEQERHLERLAGLVERGARRMDALADLERLSRELTQLSSPRELLAASAGALAQVGGVRRVVLGTVEGGALGVQRVAVRDDPARSAALLGALRGEELRLGHPYVEADLLRRRRAVVVDAGAAAGRVHPRLAAVMGWREVVAAPVATGAAVVAILYADAGPGTPVGPDAHEIVERFAAEVARSYETARLRRAIRAERQETQRLAAGLEHRARVLLDAAHQVELAPLPDPVPHRYVVADAGAALAGVLTRREHEVLQLLSEGHTNKEIADRLVLSPATVKSHVYRILGKLGVANRAQAVALYLTPRVGGG